MITRQQSSPQHRGLVAAFLVVVLGVLFVFTVSQTRAATPEELRSAIDRKARELEEVTKKIQETQINLTEESVRGSTLKAEVGRIDDTVKKVNLNIKASEIRLDKLGLEIQSVQEQIAEKERAVALKRETVSLLLLDFQQREQESLLLSFLNGQSLAQSLQDAQSISDLNEGLLSEVSELKTLRIDLAERLGEAEMKKKAVESERQTLKVKKTVAEDQLGERQRLLAETKNREENYKKIISDLEKQQSAISDEIGDIEDKLRSEYGTTSVPLKRKGVFGNPMPNARMSQGYGKTPYACKLYPRTCFHGGVDYAAIVGTPILAADDGTVAMAGNNGRVQYGKYIVLKHENGLATLYAHLSRHAAKSGDSVKRGEIIGYSGNTGYAKGPHLHFAAYLASTLQFKSIAGAGLVPIGFTLNPLDYLQ